MKRLFTMLGDLRTIILLIGAVFTTLLFITGAVQLPGRVEAVEYKAKELAEADIRAERALTQLANTVDSAVELHKEQMKNAARERNELKKTDEEAKEDRRMLIQLHTKTFNDQ